MLSYPDQTVLTSGAKAPSFGGSLMYGLKPVPFKAGCPLQSGLRPSKRAETFETALSFLRICWEAC
jgi:hypothetical protein